MSLSSGHPICKSDFKNFDVVCLDRDPTTGRRQLGSHEEIYINESGKPCKVNGFGNLTNA